MPETDLDAWNTSMNIMQDSCPRELTMQKEENRQKIIHMIKKTNHILGDKEEKIKKQMT